MPTAAPATSRRSARTSVAVTATVLALLLGACSGGQPAPTEKEPRDGTVQQIAPADRVTVEAVTGRLLDGGQFDSASLDDTVAVVNVWGSWCGPCRVEAPALRQVARKYEGRVRFLGLNVKDNDAAARAFEARFRIPYPSIVSEDSPRAGLAFGGQLSTAAVPMTVVLDPQRRVAARVVGTVTVSTLSGLVEDVLAED